MTKNIFLVLFLFVIGSVSAVTINTGVQLVPRENVTFTVQTPMTVSNLTLTDGNITLDGVILDIRPSSGVINFSIESWTSDSVHTIKATGEAQNIDFDVWISDDKGIVIYNGVIYPYSFTALVNPQSFDWATQYNITLNFRDEDSRSLLAGTMVHVTLISDVFGQNYTTNTGVLDIPSLATDEYIIQYSAPNYITRSYYFSYEEGVSTNLTLFLAPNVTTEEVTMTVYDTLGNSIERASIKVSKYFPQTNSYELVETSQTNFQGEARASLDLDNAYYRFIIEYEGEQVYKAGPTIIYSDSLNFYIDLTDQSIDDMFNQLGLSGSISFNNQMNRVTYSWNDEQNTASQGCIRVYQLLRSGEDYIGELCSPSPAGTLYYDLAPDAGATYLFKGYVYRGEAAYLVVTRTEDFKTPLPDTKGSLFYMMIVMILFAFMFLWDPVIAIIAEGLVPLLFTISKLAPIGYETSVPILFLCIVVAVAIGVSRK